MFVILRLFSSRPSSLIVNEVDDTATVVRLRIRRSHPTGRAHAAGPRHADRTPDMCSG